MDYAPEPGSVPDRVIRHLLTLPDGTRLTSGELALALQIKSTGLSNSLAVVLRNNLMTREAVSKRLTYYSLGDMGREAISACIDDPDMPKSQRSVSIGQVPSIFAYADQRDASPFSSAITSDGRIVLERKGRVFAELTPEETKIHIDWLEKVLRPEVRA